MLPSPEFTLPKTPNHSFFVAITRIIPYSTSFSSNLYLGLPILMGNSKRQTFQSIVDKVLRRVDGWRAKTLS
jgi:hypothetical protein